MAGGFAGSILFFIALQRIGAGETTTLWATGPLFGLLLGVIFLRERVTRWGVLGVALVLAGIAILA